MNFSNIAMLNDNKETVGKIEIFGNQINFVKDPNREVDFKNDVVIPNFLGTNINITETIFNTWIIILIVFIFSVVVNTSIRKFKEIPKGFQNFVEAIVEMFQNFTRSTMGEHNMKFAPFYFGIFVFVVMCNLSGLFALRPPTADYATTFALGILTFFMIQGFGIVKQGPKSYIKSFFEPVFILFPINLIGELATPISLSFRLFGNILGGTIIMALFYSMPWLIIKLGVPAILHVYFDVFAGVLQAFIFTMLSMTFVSNAIPTPSEK